MNNILPASEAFAKHYQMLSNKNVIGSELQQFQLTYYVDYCKAFCDLFLFAFERYFF
jgi:hypothetical protein